MYLHAFSVPLAGSTNQQQIRIRPLRTARKGQEDTVQIVGAGGDEIVLTPLREEVVTSLAGPMQVLQREEGNRRTTCTDWNERSSQSRSVFRMVIEA